MEVYVFYFYQIRFMNKLTLPLSTAIYDPKWFHRMKDQNEIFIDKNGVINGLRISSIIPKGDYITCCSGRNKCGSQPESCYYMRRYKSQLKSLNFSDFMSQLLDMSEEYKKIRNLDGDIKVVLVVHESPDNKYSEREVLKQWFSKNNYLLEEWNKDDVNILEHE